MHDNMDELHIDGGETSNVSYRLTFERLPPAKLEEKPAPDEMSMEMRMEECLREIDYAHRGDSSTDPYCLELLRRATFQDDPQIWEKVQRCFSETVRGWMERHPSRTAEASLNSEENYVAQAFAKLYEAAFCKRVQFSRHSDALKYLQASLNSVILDSLRSYPRPHEIAPPLSDKGGLAADQSENGEVWEIISRLLPDIRKQCMAYLLFHCGLGPKDIVHMFPEEFHDEHEIALLRCTVIGRLLDDIDQYDGTIDKTETQIVPKCAINEGEEKHIREHWLILFLVRAWTENILIRKNN
jgi:hypothetical protein